VKRTDGFYYQPRLHDFRHTFAVRRLVTWYREGKNVQRLLPHLATYLGHVSIRETSRYLTMTKELLDEASHRFELYASPGGKQ
jgi:integrase